MTIIIITVILVLFVLLLFAPLKFVAEYENGELRYNIYFCGIKVSSSKKQEKSPPKDSSEKAEKFKENVDSLSLKLSDIIKLCKTAVRLLKKYVSVKEIRLGIKVGTGDAALTAISTGALWAAVYNLIGLVGRIMYIDNHKVEITPDYQNALFEAHGKCIISSRVVYIIIIAITILLKIKSLKEEVK